MKKLTLVAAVAATLLSTNLLADNTDRLTIKVGGANVTAESESNSGGSLGMEGSLVGNSHQREQKGYDIFVDLGVIFLDGASSTKYGLGWRMDVAPKLQAGVNLGVYGYEFDSGLSFIGFGWGINTKYSMTKNHSIIAEYTSQALSDDDTGLVDIDVSTLGVSYAYSF